MQFSVILKSSLFGRFLPFSKGYSEHILSSINSWLCVVGWPEWYLKISNASKAILLFLQSSILGWSWCLFKDHSNFFLYIDIDLILGSNINYMRLTSDDHWRSSNGKIFWYAVQSVLISEMVERQDHIFSGFFFF